MVFLSTQTSAFSLWWVFSAKDSHGSQDWWGFTPLVLLFRIFLLFWPKISCDLLRQPKFFFVSFNISLLLPIIRPKVIFFWSNEYLMISRILLSFYQLTNTIFSVYVCPNLRYEFSHGFFALFIKQLILSMCTISHFLFHKPYFLLYYLSLHKFYISNSLYLTGHIASRLYFLFSLSGLG